MAVSDVVDRVKRMPVIRVVVAVQQRYGEEGAGLLSSAIAYHAFFSLFPLILVGFSVLGFVLDDPETRREFAQTLTDTIPGLGAAAGDSIDAVVNARAATGIFGLLGFAWTGTQVVRAAGRSMSLVFNIELDDDNAIKQNLWAIGSLLTLGSLAAIAMGVSFLGSNLPSGNVFFSVLLIAAGGVVDVGLFLLAYRVLTRGSGPSFKAMVPGAILAAFGWTVLKLIGSWYARKTVGDATAVYGTFAGAIGILVLLSVGARLFMYGAVLNVVRLRENPELQTEVMEMDKSNEIPRGSENGDRSTIRLVRDIADDTATLVKKEVELARQEMLEAINARLRAGAALAGAAVLGLLVLVFLGLAAEAGLDNVMADWAARLVVAGGALVIIGGAVLFARTKLKSPPIKPEETVRTVKEDVEWAKAQLKR